MESAFSSQMRFFIPNSTREKRWTINAEDISRLTRSLDCEPCIELREVLQVLFHDLVALTGSALKALPV